MTATAPVVHVRPGAVSRELVSSGALGRALRWQALAVSAVAAVAAGAAGIAGDGLPALRVAAVLLALGAGFVFDDAAAAIAAAAPVTRAQRVRLRVAVGVLSATAAFAVVCTTERSVGIAVLAGVALEAATVLTIAFAAAAAAHFRFDVPEPGLAGAAAIGAVIVTAYASAPWLMLMPAAGPGWGAAHLRWAGLFALALAALITAGREP